MSNIIRAVDFSAIEARVTAWLAGEEKKLDVFRAYDAGHGKDPYCVTAEGIYGEPIDEDDPRRQGGKVSDLACIAEGELVTTDQGFVPIENITIQHKVWDGTSFVPHNGLVYRGVRDVIEHDGLRATEDHEVWVEGKQKPVFFGRAASSGERLLRSEPNWKEVWLGGDYLCRTKISTKMVGLLCSYTLHWLWARKLDMSFKSFTRYKQRVPNLHPPAICPKMAPEARYCDAPPLYKSERQSVGELWGARSEVSLPFGAEGSDMDPGELRTGTRYGNRQDGQQRALRTWKFTLRNTIRTIFKQTYFKSYFRRFGVGAWTEPSKSIHDREIYERRSNKERYNRHSQKSYRGQTQELARNTEKNDRVRVYDILNCGPNNCFTVSGCLVHNCGFGGGVGALAKMAKTYALDLGSTFDHVWSAATPTNKEKAAKAWEDRGKKSGMMKKKWFAAEAIKLAWRDNSPNTVALWKAIEDSAIEATLHPGKISKAGNFLKYRRSGSWLFCQLPSKRVITYPYPRVEWKQTPWGSERPQLIYKGVDSFSKKWCDQHFYGGLGTENAVQGTARDVMRDAMLRVEKAGYRLILTVHDEIVTENRQDFGTLADLNRITSEQPTWAPGLPITAKGWEGPRYRK